jgi:hypothetical protein
MQDELYSQLNKAWKSTSKILFGEEVGELDEFKEYLSEPLVGKTVESTFSGKKLWVGSNNYLTNARFFDFNCENSEYDKIISKEIEFNKIKDIDSLIEAVTEKIIYAGNKVFGNSKNVVDSDSVIDSSNILNSSRLIGCKYVAYSYMMQFNDYSFGSSSSGESKYIARCFGNNSLNRCFETCGTIGASDCYFSYNVWNCSESLFSFNLRSKRHTIANIQLDEGKYIELKRKLIAEISDDLKRKKGIDFSILDILRGVTV